MLCSFGQQKRWPGHEEWPNTPPNMWWKAGGPLKLEWWWAQGPGSPSQPISATSLSVQVPCHLIFLKWLYFLPELYKEDSTKNSFFSYAVSSRYSSSSWLRWSQALVSFNLLLNLAESAFLQELLASALHWSGSRTSLPTYELLQDAHQGTTVAAKPCSFIFLNTWIIYCYVNNISWWTFKFFPFLDYSEHSSNEYGRAYISRVLRVCT